jgi:hypothetical protein
LSRDAYCAGDIDGDRADYFRGFIALWFSRATYASCRVTTSRRLIEDIATLPHTRLHKMPWVRPPTVMSHQTFHSPEMPDERAAPSDRAHARKQSLAFYGHVKADDFWRRRRERRHYAN